MLEKGDNVTREDIHKANEQAFNQYDKESLYPCAHCGRTFGYDQLQRHKKVCTAVKFSLISGETDEQVGESCTCRRVASRCKS